MKVVRYGDWEIAVDVDRTKQYYKNYNTINNQANRNFAKYLKDLTPEEKDFFNSLEIDPSCCEIEHIGLNNKGDFPCGGYFLVCGEYLKTPPENILTFEELVKNNFVDNRPDTSIYIGIFKFNFQCQDYIFKNIPENMPDGFICIQFWCEEMKWLLNEKPEKAQNNPHSAWDIHKNIKEKIDIKQEQSDWVLEEKLEFSRFFEKLNINATLLSNKELEEYKKEWVDRLSPKDANIRKIRKLCVKNKRYTTYLWHLFSFNFLNCEIGDNANTLFDKTQKGSCVIVSNIDDLAYKLENAESLTVESLEQFIDVTITADDFSWTYSKTHESMCGPYFYKQQ